MSYNGSGTFNINSTGQPVVTGTAISSTVFNAFTADIGTGLSTALTKDGQTVATARIPFAAGINSSLVTDATSTTTGSIITAGGVGVAKALFVGTTANIAGTATLAGVTATSLSSTIGSNFATSSGNVGIGTATPAYKLDVSGTLGVTGAVTLSTALPVASGGTGLTSIAHTVQVFTSGSGTYTTPANVKAIWVRAVGGGGGAGGSGSAGSPANGTGGGSTTFSTLTASAGAGGPNSLTGGFTGGTAGGASGGDINQTGNPGTSAPGNTIPALYQAYGCNGGASVLGGGGIAASNGAGGTGGAGTANSGGGGGGVGGNSVTYASAGGGGAGYVEKLIAAPAATYAYAVGAGGAGGASGTGGGTGGAGGSGVIIVTEYYV